MIWNLQPNCILLLFLHHHWFRCDKEVSLDMHQQFSRCKYEERKVAWWWQLEGIASCTRCHPSHICPAPTLPSNSILSLPNNINFFNFCWQVLRFLPPLAWPLQTLHCLVSLHSSANCWQAIYDGQKTCSIDAALRELGLCLNFLLSTQGKKRWGNSTINPFPLTLYMSLHTCAHTQRLFTKFWPNLEDLLLNKSTSTSVHTALWNALRPHHYTKHVSLTGSLFSLADNKCVQMAVGPSHSTGARSDRIPFLWLYTDRQKVLMEL